MTTCAGCGFVYATVPRLEIPGRLADVGPRVRAAWEQTGPSDPTPAGKGPDAARPLRPTAMLLRRPDSTTWSALEYGAHLRDVLFVQRDRLVRILVEDGPPAHTMYRDERVDILRYRAQVPAQVLDELTMAGHMAAWAFQGLDDDGWARTCEYHYPEPAVRSLEWVGQHTVHEIEHHLGDIVAVLAQAGGV